MHSICNITFDLQYFFKYCRDRPYGGVGVNYALYLDLSKQLRQASDFSVLCFGIKRLTKFGEPEKPFCIILSLVRIFSFHIL